MAVFHVRVISVVIRQWVGKMDRQIVKIGPGGRIVIPAEIRSRLNIKTGDTLVLTESAGEIRLSTIEAGTRHAQVLIGRYVSADVNLADELIAERRIEAKRE
ncbi:AbrB/MazE/SpoVT family DNA-binding domain-containing protein [Methylococcus sp. ANG]|uniref:AbrB/MazE/SpoVT family DNA-binding domain-containing protein n=1 Tax=Methylococcus sp. ANG TaxID=3231903 RepID=UPI00345B14A9